MFHNRYVIHMSESSSGWRFLLALGLLLILFGTLVLYYPELLAYLVAGFFIFLGLTMVSSALALRPRGTRSSRIGF